MSGESRELLQDYLGLGYPLDEALRLTREEMAQREETMKRNKKASRDGSRNRWENE